MSFVVRSLVALTTLTKVCFDGFFLPAGFAGGQSIYPGIRSHSGEDTDVLYESVFHNPVTPATVHPNIDLKRRPCQTGRG